MMASGVSGQHNLLHVPITRTVLAQADDLDGVWWAGPGMALCRTLVRTRKVQLGADGVASGYGVRAVEACRECNASWCGGDGIPSTWTMVDLR